jgi:hypothetical protein
VAKSKAKTKRREEMHIPRSDMRVFLRKQKRTNKDTNKTPKEAGAQTITATISTDGSGLLAMKLQL